MASPSDNQFTFVTAAVASKVGVFVLAEPPSPSAAQASALFRWSNGFRGQTNYKFPAAMVASLPGKELTVIGVEGEVNSSRHDAGKVVVSDTHVDPSTNGPSGRGWLRDARFIGGHLYAVGMSRQAYARTPDDKWLHIEGDMLASLGVLAGLNGVDGFSASEIYAAGLDGEIWRHDGRVWKQLVSPTNVQLNAARRCGDFIYMAGSSGVVLRGRHDRFEVVATASNQDNLYGLAGLGAEVFVASMKKIFVLRDDSLDEVDTGLGEITTGALDANDGVLWSVGAKHIVHTADGSVWTQEFL